VRANDQDVKDRKLAKLWSQGIPVEIIAREMGFHRGSSITHAARRLGLPRRTPNRNIEPANRANRIRLAEKHALQVAMAEREERTGRPKNGLKHEPVPTLFRCKKCQGRCTAPEGHPQCAA
jgi:hypothetical protein